VNLLKIATIGNPVLRQMSRQLSREELALADTQRFIDDLVATMRDAAGAGLAANQVFHPVQICAIEVENNPRYPYKPNIPLTVLVNPVLQAIGEEVFGNYEGCLSVPDLRGEVFRHVEVRVRAWDRTGEDLDFVVRGLSAGTFQHEVDHLLGKLFVDRVRDTTTLSSWKEFERHRMSAFVARARALVARFGS
jgi:peptide deformylase